MTNQEKNFDLLLTDMLSDIPPEDMVSEVTPWKQAMSYILIGMAFQAVTLGVLKLDYILPAVGMLLSLLGFRALRQINSWFTACYFLMIIRSVCFWSYLVLNTTIFHSIQWINMVGTGVFGVQLFCFCLGLKTLNINGAFPLIIWYALIAILGVMGYGGWTVIIGLIILYFIIILNLYRISAKLEDVGYVMKTAPIKISDHCVVILLTGFVAIGCFCGYSFGNKYPMEWEIHDTEEENEITEIKSHLSSLGFPEEVLRDITPEDIVECKDALQVIVNNRCLQPDEKMKNHSIAVQLSGEQERWKFFHHFSWNEDTKFYGTEAIILWPVYKQSSEEWSLDGSVTGKLYYDKGNQIYTAPYYTLEEQTYTTNGFFGMMQMSMEVCAEFSMPDDAANCRGYMAYSARGLKEGYGVTSWLNYTHQETWLQYPVMTAKEKMLSGMWNYDSTFRTIQNRFILDVSEEGEEKID